MKPLLPWKSNKYYIFLFVCVSARLCAGAYARARIIMCVGVFRRLGACMCVGACSLAYLQHACAILYSPLRPLWLHHVFRYHFINGTIFEKMLLNTKCVFRFSIQLFSKTFRVLRTIQRDIVINVKMCSCKVAVILVRF